MNYKCKRLTDTIKPLCKCKRDKVRDLIDVVHKQNMLNKNFTVQHLADAIEGKCIENNVQRLTKAELIWTKTFSAGEIIDFYVDTITDGDMDTKYFYIQISDGGEINIINAIFHNGSRWIYSTLPAEDTDKITLSLSNADVEIISNSDAFKTSSMFYDSTSALTSTSYHGPAYIYRIL